jgi:MinD superfamily P-loop ATPase
MAHARLGIAQANSGKLVTTVRTEALKLTLARQRQLLISDGSPGIGCPVIASMVGTSMVLIVTEPTLSGLHDLERVVELCLRFNLSVGLCINKVDLNPQISAQIESWAQRRSIPVLGRVRYDDSVTIAQLHRQTVVEWSMGPASRDIRALWERLRNTVTPSARSLEHAM